jgi:CheY-like chemotaxis protein
MEVDVIDARYPELIGPDKGRILIVDDEKAVREVYRAIVSYGFPECKIDLVENGAEAVASFQKLHQCLILLDLCMPVMGGEQAFRGIERLCDQQNWCMPHVIFCSAFEPSHLLDDIIHDDPRHECLSKPPSTDKLIRSIGRGIAA